MESFGWEQVWGNWMTKEGCEDGAKAQEMRKCLRKEMVEEANVRDQCFMYLSCLKWAACKYQWSGGVIPVNLLVCSYAILQLEVPSNRILAEYCYKDIAELIKVSDASNTFIISHSPWKRLHMFSCDNSSELLERVKMSSYENVGVACKISTESVPMSYFRVNRLGSYNGKQHLTSLAEFCVEKISVRHKMPVPRLLCLSETCLVERDVVSYNIITLKPLSSIFSLIRCENDPQLFYVEFFNGILNTYKSVERDNVLVTLLDAVRTRGSVDVHVKMSPTNTSYRWIPFFSFLDEEGEAQHAKFIGISFSARNGLLDALRRFNSNVPYGGLMRTLSQEGLFSASKEKLIVNSAMAIVEGGTCISPEDWENMYHALRRLFASKAGFHAFANIARLREKLGNMVICSLKLNNEAVDHAAIETLCTLMQPMNGGFELKQEQQNKSLLLSSKAFLERMLDILVWHVVRLAKHCFCSLSFRKIFSLIYLL
ncbi:DnaJ-like protein subfamily C member 13 [Trichuris trichiura]|uniref:DnaJ-like protein subfamily C member 13 n=1 Tax=Trichuris trichiura TaxID=36087 RepID=A0A077ZJB2_TRITR|nr:DnaJ-like protein subfamily C member 13 [Trichuris trichiura]